MRKLTPAFLPVAAAVATLFAAAPVLANQPSATTPQVSVTVGGDLLKDVKKLGERDVQAQIDELTQVVERALARDAATDARWAGARLNLVLTDLKPNRPTIQQASDRPGLSMHDSRSIGGATIEGELITAQGESLPVRYDRYSTNISDVYGYNTWTDADRAFDGLASNLRRGQLTNR